MTGWPLVALLVAYPLLVIAACALSVWLVLRIHLFQHAEESRWERQEAKRDHELRLLSMKKEAEEKEFQKTREERTARIEDTMSRMGWKPPESTVPSSHPAGHVPPSPEDADRDRFGRNVRRLEEMEEMSG